MGGIPGGFKIGARGITLCPGVRLAFPPHRLAMTFSPLNLWP